MIKKGLLAFSCLLFINGCSTPNLVSNSTVNIKDNSDELIKNYQKKQLEQSYKNAYSSYSFSKNFINKLKDYVKDKVLNKVELEDLTNNGSSGEKNFINILKNKDSFIMTNLKESENESDQLEFIISKDFTVNDKFIKSLNKYIQDNLLEKSEIEELLKNATNDEKNYIKDITQYDIYNNFPTLNQKNEIFETNLKIFYDENQLVHGKNTFEILSNIAQSDRLVDTYTDPARCGASLIINALLLVKGKKGFFDFSKKLGFNFDELTYKNVHLTQERLMSRVPSFRGLSIRNSIVENNIVGGTFFKALKIAGIEWQNDFVKKNYMSYKEEIEGHLLNQDNNAIILTDYVYQEKERKIDKKFEHASLLTYKDGEYYLTDTSGRNGSGENHIRLSNQDMNDIYTNNSPLIKIRI